MSDSLRQELRDLRGKFSLDFEERARLITLSKILNAEELTTDEILNLAPSEKVVYFEAQLEDALRDLDNLEDSSPLHRAVKLTVQVLTALLDQYKRQIGI